MRHKVSKEIKDKATLLRAQGMSYNEISVLLPVSISWCKQNLKTERIVSKTDISELEQISKGDKGLTKAQIYESIKTEDMPNDVALKEVNKVSQRLRKRSKDNLVRPSWMVPKSSMFCTDSVIEFSMNLEERLHEQASELRSDLIYQQGSEEGIPSISELKSAIGGILYTTVSRNKQSGAILENWLESLYKTANELKNRNHQSTGRVTKQSIPKDFSDLEEFMY
jgi:hypothetical protein